MKIKSRIGIVQRRAATLTGLCREKSRGAAKDL